MNIPSEDFGDKIPVDRRTYPYHTAYDLDLGTGKMFLEVKEKLKQGFQRERLQNA